MNWIQRLFGRVKRPFGQEASFDVLHALPPARTGLFRDYGPRHRGWEPIDKFDPFNLVLSTRPSQPHSEERDMVLRGEFDQARTIIHRKMDSMNQRDLLQYMLDVTNPVHELRHFHDFLGTRVGMRRFLRTVIDSQDFSQLVSALRDDGLMKLPLVDWHNSGGGPDALREYLWKRAEYTDWLRLYDGTQQVTAKVPGLKGLTGMYYSVGKSRLLIPNVEIELQFLKQNRSEKRVFLLGAQALMEGAAICVQRKLIAKLFGDDQQQLFLNAISRGSADNWDFVQYVLVQSYMSQRVGKHHPHYQLMLTDLAMMVEGNDAAGGHPGVYFLDAMNKAEELETEWTSIPNDFLVFMDSVSEANGWGSCHANADTLIHDLQAKEQAFNALPDPKSWPDVLLNGMYGVQKRITQIRKECPSFMADVDLYLALISKLPQPLAEWDGEELRTFGTNIEEAAAVQAWYFWDYLKRQLLFSKKMPCPNPKGDHDCIGSLLNQKQRQDGFDCPFREFLEQIGLLDMKYEAA